MALTRAQLLMGDSGQGPILPGQVQAVKAGNGITIIGDGTIEVNSQTIVGVMKLGQTPASAAAAYNKYNWPVAVTGAQVGRQLTVTSVDGSGNATLQWQDSDGIDWTQRGQIIAATAAGETNDTLVNIGSARSFLMSRVDDPGNPSGFSYSDVITSAMKVPAGDGTQRPLAGLVAGEFRFNTTQGKLEVWNGIEWQTVASADPDDGSFVAQINPAVAAETDVAVIPSGTTLQRITSPAPIGGYFRYNDTTDKLEFHNGITWEEVASGDPTVSTFVVQTVPPAGKTASAIIPPGPAGQEETVGVQGGWLRYNTTDNLLEFHNGTSWELVAPSGGGVHSFVQGPAAPTAFNDGDLWYDTTLQRESVSVGGVWVQPGVSQSGPTGFATIPTGSTGQRGAPATGAFRLNNDNPADSRLEFWNGTSWQQVASGTSPLPPIPATVVSSVDVSGGTTGLSFTGGPVTTSGTMTMSGTLGIGNGGTGATSGAAALANLGMSVDTSGGTTGMAFTGGPVTSAGTMVMSGTLNIANGGTGQATANDALNALLPPQGGNANLFLQTDGTNTTWAAAGGGGGSQTFSAPGLFFVPAGVTSITVDLIGGGGGGGRGPGATIYGGGGGSAGFLQGQTLAVTPLTNVSVTVGAGGGFGGVGPGGPGGSSSVGTITVTGGGGGAGGCCGFRNGGAGGSPGGTPGGGAGGTLPSEGIGAPASGTGQLAGYGGGGNGGPFAITGRGSGGQPGFVFISW